MIPDDTYEAQARGNYVSWTDHRVFMEKTYAEFFGFVLKELQKIDPEAVGLFVNRVPLFRGGAGGYIEQSVVETLTRHRFSRFDAGAYLRLQLDLVRTRWALRRRGWLRGRAGWARRRRRRTDLGGSVKQQG